MNGQKTWDGGAGTLNWNDGNNWSPNGIPGNTDAVLFNTGTTLIITNVPNVTITKLNVTNSTTITLKPTNANRTITITSATTDALVIGSGSSLYIAGRDAATDRTLTLSLSNTANLEADISGTLGVELDNSQAAAYGIISKGASAVIRFKSGSTYTHAVNSGTIPAAEWNASSTCSITGTTSTFPSGISQTFGNLDIKATAITSPLTATLSSALTVQGNLTLEGASSTNTMTLNPSNQNLIVNGTTTIKAYGILNDNNSGGTNRFDQLVTVNSNGQFTNSNNPAYEYRGGITNSGTFNAGTGTHSFTTSSQALSGTLSIPNLTVTGISLTNNNTLTVSTSLSGTGELIQAASATLNSGGTTTVSILTATASGNLVNYNGTGQSVKSASYYDLTVSAAGSNQLAGDVTVSNTLTLSGGSLAVGSNTLTLNGGSVAGTPANLSTTSSSSLQFGGSSAGVTIPSGVAALNNIGTTNPNTISMQSSITVSGTFNPGGGGFSIGSNTLTLNGQVNCGTLTGGSSSNIVIGGSGSASLSGVSINNLTISRNTDLCGSLGISGTLSLSSGILSLGSNTMTIDAGGSISYGSGSISGGSSSNLVVGTGSDISLRAIQNGLNNLTISRNVSLSGDLSISGTLNLVAGNLSIGAYTMTLSGPAIAGTPSNLSTGSSSSLVFSGSNEGISVPSSISSLKSLTVNNSYGITLNSNITLASDGVLTMSSGNINAGSYTLKLTNTSPAGALSWSNGTFINVTTGGFERSLQANLAGTGNNYLFPVGENGTYKGLNLSDVNTGAAGPVLFVSVSGSGAVTADGTTVSSVDPRYWTLLNQNSGNFTSAAVELFEAGIDISRTMAMAASYSGAYSSVGGTASASSIISPVISNPGSYLCTGSKMTSFYSRQSGNLTSSSTWSTTSGGPTSTYAPYSGNTIYIENGHTVTVTENFSCSAVTFTGATGSLSVNESVTLAITGNLTMLKQSSSAASCSVSGSGTITCSNVEVGTAANPSPSNFGGNTYVHNLTSTISNLTISNNLTISSYFRLLLYLRNGTFSHENGTVTVGGSIVTVNSNALNTSTYTMASGLQSGVLRLTGASPFSLTTTSTINLNGTSSVVNYGRSGDQTVYATSYRNLTVDGSGVKTLTGSTVNGILSMEGTATASGTPSFGASASVQYKGATGQTTGSEIPATFSGSGGLIIDNGSGVSLGADLVLNSPLSLVTGEFSLGSRTLTLQNNDTPVTRNAGTLSTNSNSNLSFGSSGNTSGAAFTLPDNIFKADPEINNLTIYRTNSLAFNNQMLSVHGILLCNGPLNTNGKITLLSDHNGTALISGSGTGAITGNVTMQRYLQTGFGYKYFSSPFQAATVSEFSDDMNLGASFTTFYRYDETRTSSGWVNYKTGTNVLVPMAGYAVNFGAVHGPNTVDITGAVNNGSLSVTLYNNNRTYTKGYNLVGNPYPSPIDWNAASGWTKTNIDNALYFFKASNSDQYSGTNSTYINGVSSDGSATNIIPSMQGFFIHVSDGSYPVTATLGMTNSVRVTDMTHSFIKGDVKPDKSLIRLTAAFTDTKLPDASVIYFDPKAGSGFDSDFDALKLMNTDSGVPNLYSVTEAGTKLSINALSPENSGSFSIPLGLKVSRDGKVVFTMNDIEGDFDAMRILLLDKATATETEMGKNSDYSVNVTTGEYLNRFFLNFYYSSTDIPLNKPEPAEAFKVHYYNGIMRAQVNTLSGNKGTLVMSNLPGQVVFRHEINESGYYEFSPAIKDGIYIVTFTSGTTRTSKKLIVTH